MIKVIVDTNILIDYVNGYAEWVRKVLRVETGLQLILPTIVIAEYFTSQALEDLYEVSVADKTFALFEKQDLTEGVAKVLGKLLRHKTYPPGAGVVDLIIASTAIYLDAQLATNNKVDFKGIPNLKFFDPKKI